jgi:LysR family glycine cleavage system transcriptional activator
VNPNQRTSLRGLRTFCVAAEHGSFRDAADALFITASAVSHQIKNLEQELGQPLFDRLTRSVALTEAGKSLYDEVRPLISRLDSITSSYRRTSVKSTLRISVQPFFASEVFVPSLSEFRHLHPDIEINVDTSDEAGEKHPANADASIRVFSSAPEGLESDHLFDLRLVPAVSTELRKEIVGKRKKPTGDFARIVHDSRADAWRQWQTESGVRLSADASILRLDSMIAVARAAERGLGAALVPVQLSDSWFDSGTLVRLFEHELVTSDAFYFVCRKEDAQNPSVQKLRAWVLQKFDEAA